MNSMKSVEDNMETLMIKMKIKTTEVDDEYGEDSVEDNMETLIIKMKIKTMEVDNEQDEDSVEDNMETLIMAGMAVFQVAGYLIEEWRRWPVITASPRGQYYK